jgi:hypothetical protein
MKEKQYDKALLEVSDVELEQVKVLADLNLIADIFKKNNDYQGALEVYRYLYEKVQSRRILYQLIRLLVQCNLLEEAKEYYEEYLEMPSPGSDRLILKYYLDKGEGTDRKVLIQDLEALKKEDYIEEWGYELAKLYHKEGMEKECIEECKDIIMWFGEGKIVDKARLLKLHYEDGVDISSPKAIEETLNLTDTINICKSIYEKSEAQKENDTPVNQLEKLPQIEVEEELPKLTLPPQTVMEAEAEQPQTEIKEETEAEQPQTESKEAELEQPQTENKEEAEPEPELILPKIEAEDEGKSTLPHFAIIGEDKEAVTEAAKKLSKALAKKGIIKAAKLGRVESERLNEINLADKLPQLRDGCLLISHAGKLSINSMQSLNQMMNHRKNGIVIILSDTEEELKRIFAKNRNLKNKIESEIRV